LVYEADVIAGITRFLAVYYHHDSPEIGPVRSARLFIAQMAHAYNSPYAHAGGSEDSIAFINATRGFKDLCEIRNAGRWFWRSQDRRPPHNLYTSTTELLKAADAKGYALVPPPPLAEGTPLGGEPAMLLTIAFREDGDRNVVTYKYEKGAYRRYINDKPHMMKDGSEIWVANVVILFTDTKVIGGADPQLINRVTGTGDALFFVRGLAYEGTWSKPSSDQHFAYQYQGQSMLFSSGKTWVHLVGSKKMVSYNSRDS